MSKIKIKKNQCELMKLDVTAIERKKKHEIHVLNNDFFGSEILCVQEKKKFFFLMQKEHRPANEFQTHCLSY